MTACLCRCHTTGSSHVTCDVDGGHGVGCGPHSFTPAVMLAEIIVAPRALWDAADAITNPTRIRLQRDVGPGEWVTLPSLWLQLVDAIDKDTMDGGNGKQQSRPPLNTAALSLLLEISTGVRDWMLDAGLKRTRDVPKDLRSIVSHVIATTEQKAMGTTLETLRRWRSRVKATISNDPDRTWRMHGAACRVCSSTSVPVFDDDGTETRQPALIVHSEDGVIDRIECAFCSSILTGPDLTAILYDTLKRADLTGDERKAV
jgi:hypothetical protein